MKIENNSLWINNKNKKNYTVIQEALDCTNQRDGLVVVVYRSYENPEMLFVREKEEFLQKFTNLQEVK